MKQSKYMTLVKQALPLCVVLLLGACGGGGAESTSSVSDPPPSLPPVAPTPAPTPTPTPTPVPSAPQIKLDGFVTVTDAAWDDTAVRKVLHTFAYGGHASDQQIATWADMDPSSAITQMLTFEEHNVLLSPPSPRDQDGLATRSGKLRDLAAFWASDDPANGFPPDVRSRFDYSNGGGYIEPMWPMTVAMRGLNPFRQRIAYWEVNQHLVANLNAGVSVLPLLRHYDDIAESLEAGDSYDKVLATAAASAAIAIQYGHRLNRIVNGKCACNEDFSREFYQLFFGIFGEDDPQYHETVTIKNTAKALTGMVLYKDANNIFTDDISYSEDLHYSGTLEMLGQNIDGADARERITALAALAINHPESQANLPVMIIGGLADDNLDTTKVSNIRRAWADMGEKDLLLFLRAYAISDMFHSEQRIKYLTSLERRLTATMKLSQGNDEIYQKVYSVVAHVFDGINTFRPIDNVFGGQTGEMASNSAQVFRANFNQSTESYWRYWGYISPDADFVWTKDWRLQIPAAGSDEITVAEATEWLWNHFLADNGKHLGALERAHLYALIARGKDLAYLIDADNPGRVYTENDVVTNSAIADLIESLGVEFTRLHAPDADERLRANQNLGQAVNFIAATPYMFYQEGR